MRFTSEKNQEREKQCKQCKKKFPAQEEKHLFCSSLCRSRYWNKHHPTMKNVIKVCPNCGMRLYSTKEETETKLEQEEAKNEPTV
jgi:hypothetical protein